MATTQSLEAAQADLQQHYDNAHKGRPGLACSICVTREKAVEEAARTVQQQAQAPAVRH